MSPFYCVVEETNGNKWENPEETELELQLRSYLDSNKSGPAVNDTELDLERLGDQDEEYSKTATMPIEHCNEIEDAEHWNEEKSPKNDVEKSRLSWVKDPAEAEKKVETRKLKLNENENPEGSSEH